MSYRVYSKRKAGGFEFLRARQKMPQACFACGTFLTKNKTITIFYFLNSILNIFIVKF